MAPPHFVMPSRESDRAPRLVLSGAVPAPTGDPTARPTAEPTAMLGAFAIALPRCLVEWDDAAPVAPSGVTPDR